MIPIKDFSSLKTIPYPRYQIPDPIMTIPYAGNDLA
jgi:hypothetical protein